MEPTKVAFFGCGRMARAHLAALHRIDVPWQVVGVYDAASDAAAEFGRLTSAPRYASPEALLAEARPNTVHICTPPVTHADLARLALDAGAHVYVEKPFAETLVDARELVAIARTRDRVLCAGHQLTFDPVFSRLLAQIPIAHPVTMVESTFQFQPAGVRTGSASPATLAAALLDILPHPLYLLLAALEHAGAPPETVEVASAIAGPGDLEAIVRAGPMLGRLWVSVRARPVSSSLSFIGGGGTVTADFMRGSLGGTPNPGTAPLEKLANAGLEGMARAWRGTTGLARRLLDGRQAGGDYPGLVPLFGVFYRAVRGSGAAPFSAAHLSAVASLYEELAARVRGSVPVPEPNRGPASGAPLAVVTGAGGMLGRAVARSLAQRGYRVRGIGRSADPEDGNVHEWRRLDLSRDDASDALVGAEVVVHAAAATSGGYESHRLHSIEATRRLLRAMDKSGIKRLVHISSLSVLEPPRSAWERQSEATPLAEDARRLGPYTWGKKESEAAAITDAALLGIATRVVRPGALVSWDDPELPGLVGRRLLGTWHLGLGRPGLPIAVYGVDDAADAIAWIASSFPDAPSAVNLIDPDVVTRRALLERFRSSGWRARMIWVPISFIAAAMRIVRRVLGILRGGNPERLDAWAILRPRRFDTSIAASVQRRATQAPRAEPAHVEAPAAS